MKIYITYRNEDMAGGRGPMVMDKVFLHKEHANRYIDHQPGVMGRSGKWSADAFGDWKVVATDVLEYDLIGDMEHTEQLKKQALAKLTMEEKLALGFARRSRKNPKVQK